MSSTSISAPAILRSQRWALAALLLGGIVIGCSPIFVRLSEVGPMTTAFWRVALGMLPLLAWQAASPARGEADARPIGFSDYIALCVPGVMLAGDLVAWHISLHLTSVANATLLANMAPIFVTLGGWLLFRTKISRIFLIGLALALAGVVILKGGPAALGGGDIKGDVIAIIAAVFYAGYILSLGKVRSRYSTLTVMLWTTGSAAICMLPLALFFETGFWPYTLFGWAILIGLAWLSHAGGQGVDHFRARLAAGGLLVADLADPARGCDHTRLAPAQRDDRHHAGGRRDHCPCWHTGRAARLDRTIYFSRARVIKLQ